MKIPISGYAKTIDEVNENLNEGNSIKSKINMNKSNSFQDINTILGKKNSAIIIMITKKKVILSEIGNNIHFYKKKRK